MPEWEAQHFWDHHAQGVITLGTPDGPRDFKPTQGGLMGHTGAPREFVCDYNKAIGAWGLELSKQEDYKMLYCKDEVSGSPQDLSTSVYVDDVAKIHAVKDKNQQLALPGR
eukprot:10366380-Lingulodinium_polyedra.AAC.1